MKTIDILITHNTDFENILGCLHQNTAQNVCITNQSYETVNTIILLTLGDKPDINECF